VALRRFGVLVLSCALVLASTSVQVTAAVVGTQQALTLEAREQRVAAVQAQLSRDDVRAAIVGLGVDPAEAVQRVASLSDAELAEVAGHLDTLPAGGGALGIIGAVFLILLLLEVIGVIDVFKKV
jgi:hypothetical protein